MLGERRVCKLVERTGGGIAFELAVPFGRIERREPLPKARPLFGSQRLDLAFQFLNLGHSWEYSGASFVRLTMTSLQTRMRLQVIRMTLNRLLKKAAFRELYSRDHLSIMARPSQRVPD